MKYEHIRKGTFISRPNRFAAYARIAGREEKVHVKNTGRCAELLRPGAEIFLQEITGPGQKGRKTGWDLIAVKKGDRLVNMDSQIPNRVVKEWIEKGNLFSDIRRIRPETVYGNSRFDLYVEAGGRKIFIEVKGVTLEEDGIARFPDAPSERAVKHVRELAQAVKEGYEAYVFFVIQMRGAKYFTPNLEAQPEFHEALLEAAENGVHVRAWDCEVKADEIELAEEVPVVLKEPLLLETVRPLVEWYRLNRRDLPWRKDVTAYHVWVSEIMLQQTRVEAVKPYYERFLQAFPGIRELAEAPEDRLLKLWEGLGYYNRVRNMQAAARQILEEYGGEFPEDYASIRSLKGIGSYTAGAVASFAFGIPKPAVDGNVLRVVSRILGSPADIMQAKVRRRMEEAIGEVIPEDAAGDFNQGLIELGAVVCVPNGEPKCEKCPVAGSCRARAQGRTAELPVKSKAKKRRVEQKTVFIFEDPDAVAIRKRPSGGLLAGLYEFPNVPGRLTQEEAVAYSRSIGLMPVQIERLRDAKHIFSHVEWQMTGYRVRVDGLEKNCTEAMIFAKRDEIEKKYPIPSAFEAYRELF